jgi:hypothetical protein
MMFSFGRISSKLSIFFKRLSPEMFLSSADPFQQRSQSGRGEHQRLGVEARYYFAIDLFESRRQLLETLRRQAFTPTLWEIFGSELS